MVRGYEDNMLSWIYEVFKRLEACDLWIRRLGKFTNVSEFHFNKIRHPTFKVSLKGTWHIIGNSQVVIEDLEMINSIYISFLPAYKNTFQNG